MSREIKFRGWYGEKTGMLTPSFNGDINEIFAEKNGVYMQYTGLMDTNGKEIYEGDIIYWEINNGVGIESYTAVVKWSENLVKEGWNQTYKWLVGYTGNYYRGSYDELSTPAAYNDALQIIGNIYENPELLEETA